MRLDVKIAILKSGRRQYEIARDLGIPEATLSKYVRGYGVLSAERESQFAHIIGLAEEDHTSATISQDHAPDAA
jgi:predicted transcriptional regulator